MIHVRNADDRGRTDAGWLDSRHSFSFGDYHDPANVGFRALRVINEDRVAPGRGFGTHPHHDMEIFSYILAGALAHRDSLGNGRVLTPGQVQLMGAGRGVTHSEFNPSPSEPTWFLQVWIRPRERGLEPRYTEWRPRPEHASAEEVLLISPDGREGSATIRQDVEVHRILLASGRSATHELRSGRGAWVQIARGELSIDGVRLAPGDGAWTEDPGTLTLVASGDAEALLFDLA